VIRELLDRPVLFWRSITYVESPNFVAATYYWGYVMRRRFVLALLMLLSLVAVPPSSAAPATDLNALFNTYGNQGGRSV
jgi:hypothetical protein